MTTPQELEARLWRALKSDRVVMLGLNGADDGHARPMSAQREHDGRGPSWFFSSSDNALVQQVRERPGRAICTFADKGHSLFACMHGTLSVDDDRERVRRLWSPMVAAWYDGPDDPKLVLLRLDAEMAEVWLNESSVFAGLKMLLGANPKQIVRDDVAQIDLG